MVGRDAELTLLLESYARAEAGEAQVALVTGEAGIGKTRLVREFVARLPEETVVAFGHAVPLSGETPSRTERPRTCCARSCVRSVRRAVDAAPSGATCTSAGAAGPAARSGRGWSIGRSGSVLFACCPGRARRPGVGTGPIVARRRGRCTGRTSRRWTCVSIPGPDARCGGRLLLVLTTRDVGTANGVRRLGARAAPPAELPRDAACDTLAAPADRGAGATPVRSVQARTKQHELAEIATAQSRASLCTSEELCRQDRD